MSKINFNGVLLQEDPITGFTDTVLSPVLCTGGPVDLQYINKNYKKVFNNFVENISDNTLRYLNDLNYKLLVKRIIPWSSITYTESEIDSKNPYTDYYQYIYTCREKLSAGYYILVTRGDKKYLLWVSNGEYNCIPLCLDEEGLGDSPEIIELNELNHPAEMRRIKFSLEDAGFICSLVDDDLTIRSEEPFSIKIGFYERNINHAIIRFFNSNHLSAETLVPEDEKFENGMVTLASDSLVVISVNGKDHRYLNPDTNKYKVIVGLGSQVKSGDPLFVNFIYSFPKYGKEYKNVITNEDLNLDNLSVENNTYAVRIKVPDEIKTDGSDYIVLNNGHYNTLFWYFQDSVLGAHGKNLSAIEWTDHSVDLAQIKYNDELVSNFYIVDANYSESFDLKQLELPAAVKFNDGYKYVKTGKIERQENDGPYLKYNDQFYLIDDYQKYSKRVIEIYSEDPNGDYIYYSGSTYIPLSSDAMYDFVANANGNILLDKSIFTDTSKREASFIDITGMQRYSYTEGGYTEDPNGNYIKDNGDYYQFRSGRYFPTLNSSGNYLKYLDKCELIQNYKRRKLDNLDTWEYIGPSDHMSKWDYIESIGYLVGYDWGTFYFSREDLVWDQATTSDYEDVRGYIWDGSKFLLYGRSGIYTFNIGDEEADLVYEANVQYMYYNSNSGIYYAIIYDYDADDSMLYTSNNGLTWTKRAVSSYSPIEFIGAIDEYTYIKFENNSNYNYYIYYSKTNAAPTSSSRIYSGNNQIKKIGSYYYFLGDEQLVYTSNKTTLTRVAVGTNNWVRDAAYFGGAYYFGTQNGLYKSTNGTSGFSLITITDISSVNRVTVFNNKLYVIDTNATYTSSTGASNSFTQEYYQSGNDDCDPIIYKGYLIIGNRDNISYTDGTNWTTADDVVWGHIYGFRIYDNRLFMDADDLYILSIDCFVSDPNGDFLEIEDRPYEIVNSNRYVFNGATDGEYIYVDETFGFYKLSAYSRYSKTPPSYTPSASGNFILYNGAYLNINSPTYQRSDIQITSDYDKFFLYNGRYLYMPRFSRFNRSTRDEYYTDNLGNYLYLESNYVQILPANRYIINPSGVIIDDFIVNVAEQITSDYFLSNYIYALDDYESPIVVTINGTQFNKMNTNINESTLLFVPSYPVRTINVPDIKFLEVAKEGKELSQTELLKNLILTMKSKGYIVEYDEKNRYLYLYNYESLRILDISSNFRTEKYQNGNYDLLCNFHNDNKVLDIISKYPTNNAEIEVTFSVNNLYGYNLTVNRYDSTGFCIETESFIVSLDSSSDRFIDDVLLNSNIITSVTYKNGFISPGTYKLARSEDYDVSELDIRTELYNLNISDDQYEILIDGGILSPNCQSLLLKKLESEGNTALNLFNVNDYSTFDKSRVDSSRNTIYSYPNMIFNGVEYPNYVSFLYQSLVKNMYTGEIDIDRLTDDTDEFVLKRMMSIYYDKYRYVMTHNFIRKSDINIVAPEILLILSRIKNYVYKNTRFSDYKTITYDISRLYNEIYNISNKSLVSFDVESIDIRDRYCNLTVRIKFNLFKMDPVNIRTILRIRGN